MVILDISKQGACVMIKTDPNDDKLYGAVQVNKTIDIRRSSRG
jgi:hypothetical protein